MIDISEFEEKVSVALRQKNDPTYSTKIAGELAKIEWQERLYELDRSINNIKDEQDFLRYQRSLVQLFNDLYEIITAPGVDDFIAWINEITANKNEISARKLRDFLVAQYSEEGVSDSIEVINSQKGILEIDKSIFSSLLNEVSKELKKTTIILLNDEKQFENTVKDYLDNIMETLTGVNKLAEIHLTELSQLFTPQQTEGKIEFYSEIILEVIERSQSLKAIDEGDRTADLLDKVKRRLKGVTKCITVLANSKIAISQDSTYQNLFLKFKDEMVKFEGGVENNLEEFIENKWTDLEAKYNTIRAFLSNKKVLAFDEKWDAYPHREELQAIIRRYNNIIKDDILQTILTKNPTAVQQILSANARSLNDLEQDLNSVKDNILSLFQNTLSEYKSKNLTLLESLAVSQPTIHKACTNIKSLLEGLKNAVNSLEKTDDLISYLLDDFSGDLNGNNDITEQFRKALNDSGMSEHLTWLEAKLQGADQGSLTSKDIENKALISELLDKGLIKIEIQKTF